MGIDRHRNRDADTTHSDSEYIDVDGDVDTIDPDLFNAILVSENAVLRATIEVLETRLEFSERIVERVRSLVRFVCDVYASWSSNVPEAGSETFQIELTEARLPPPLVETNGAPSEQAHMRTATGARDPLSTSIALNVGPPSPGHDSSIRSTSFA